MKKRLIQFLEKIIPDQQHGLWENKSAIFNLLEITETLQLSLKRSNMVDVIYFDFSKAFDSINHRIIARKLAGLSTPFLFFKPILSFTTNRSYFIQTNDIGENLGFTTNSAVPQGSHCGPNLFNIYCYDIPREITTLGSSILMYADDTKLIVNEAERIRLQAAIDKLVTWSEEIGLMLNANKTVHMTFKGSKCKNTFTSFYYINTTTINQVSELMDLGVLFDENLTFKRHINYITAKANAMSTMAYRFKNEMHINGTYLKIVNVYQMPILLYAVEI